MTIAEAGSGEVLKTARFKVSRARLALKLSDTGSCPDRDLNTSVGEDGRAEDESEKRELTLWKVQQLEGCREGGRATVMAVPTIFKAALLLIAHVATAGETTR